jgi:hypothetical protein
MRYFRKLSDAPEILAESVTRLELANGSRIVSLPGTEGTIRGYAAASLIVIDEAARVADELLAQCTPNACGIEWKAGSPRWALPAEDVCDEPRSTLRLATEGRMVMAWGTKSIEQRWPKLRNAVTCRDRLHSTASQPTIFGASHP